MARILAVTKVTVRFQTVVPKEVRERLKLKEGDKLVWLLKEGKIVVEKA